MMNLGVKMQREKRTSGFQVSTPWGWRVNMHGAFIGGVLALAISAWVIVSCVNIIWGSGRYVPIKGITGGRPPIHGTNAAPRLPRVP
jgi:hypothetical protein